MKKTFSGYYRPSETEFRKLWDECLFVLDANVLLNLYRYSTDTRKELLDILQKIKTRLWVPHQAALEYHRNRLDVISEQREAYKEIEELLDGSRKKLESELKTYARHPLIDAERILQPIGKAFEREIATLAKTRETHPDLLEKDDILESVTQLLDARVGPSYDQAMLAQIYKEGEERYSKLIPPGYKDVKAKNGASQFGDLVLWFQLRDQAIKKKSPIILVTDDAKEDWWWKHGGKTIGPKPELVEEMLSKAKVSFYMYRSVQFMEYARRYLRQSVGQGAIEEIRNLSARNDLKRRDEVRMNELRQKIRWTDAELSMLDSKVRLLNARMSELAVVDPGGTPPLIVESLGTQLRESEERVAQLRANRADLEKILQTEELLLGLTQRERQVIRMRFGLDDNNPRKWNELAERLGATPRAVREIEARALRKLRHLSTEETPSGS